MLSSVQDRIRRKREEGIPLTEEEKALEMDQDESMNMELLKNMGMGTPGRGKPVAEKPEPESKLSKFMNHQPEGDNFSQKVRRGAREGVDTLGNWITSESDYPDARAGVATLTSELVNQMVPDPDLDQGGMMQAGVPTRVPGLRSGIIKKVGRSSPGELAQQIDKLSTGKLKSAYDKAFEAARELGHRSPKIQNRGKNSIDPDWKPRIQKWMDRHGYDINTGKFSKPESLVPKKTELKYKDIGAKDGKTVYDIEKIK